MNEGPGTMFPWEAFCSEVVKLKVQRHERGQLVRLSLAASGAQRKPRLVLRIANGVLPEVLEQVRLPPLVTRAPEGGMRMGDFPTISGAPDTVRVAAAPSVAVDDKFELGADGLVLRHS
jgi:hypothetical protein